MTRLLGIAGGALGVGLVGLVPVRTRRRLGRPRRRTRRPGGPLLLGALVVLTVSLAAQPPAMPQNPGAPGPGKAPPSAPLDEDILLHRELLRRAGPDGPDRAPLQSGDTRMIARLTGPGSINRTDERWNIHGTDLGHMFWHGGRLYLVFGDTFGPTFGSEWRSNTLAWVDDPEPEDGLRFSGMVTNAAGHAGELLSSQKIHGVEMTVIPTYGFSLGDRMVLHYMSVKQWETPGRWLVNYAGLAYSDDDGATWVKHPHARWPGTSNFAQVAVLAHGGYLYLFGIPAGRFGGAQLARVRPADALDAGRYRYWNGSSWVAEEGDAATLVPAPVGELSVAWSAHFRLWVMLYLDEHRHGIVLRSARRLTGPWSAPHLVASAVDHPQVYAPYIVPNGLHEPQLYFTVSEYEPPYDVFLMRTTLRPAG